MEVRSQLSGGVRWARGKSVSIVSMRRTVLFGMTIATMLTGLSCLGGGSSRSERKPATVRLADWCRGAERTASVSGLVVNDSTGRPAQGVRIRLYLTDCSTFSDTAGRYHLRVPPGRYSLVLESDYYYQWSRPRLDLHGGSAVARDLHVAPLLCTDAGPLGRLSGVVVDSAGRPIEGATVDFGEYPCGAVTSRNGRFTIFGVPAGRQTVRTRRIGYAPATPEVLIQESGVTEIRVELRPVAIPIAY